MSDLGKGHPREMLSAYLDDELPVEERTAVDRHLAECEDCRAQLASLRLLSRAVAGEDVPAVPHDLTERIGRRLDAATVLRPRRSRFVVPATIAATIGAIGLLVTLQWREGVVMQPAMPEPKLNRQEPPQSPTPEEPAARVKERAKRDDLLDKDAKAEAAPVVVPEAAPEAEEDRASSDSAAGEPGVVLGGAVGGIPNGVEGGVGQEVAGAREREFAADERADQVAPTSAAAPPPVGAMKSAVARAEADSGCGERWTDSGVRGSWNVANAAEAARELDRIGRDVGGSGTWRGSADGRPYQLIVPRARFEEVFFALRARGISGLDELPTPPPGDDCLALSVSLTGPSR